MTSPYIDALENLNALSARLGRTPTLIQAAGGNTSLKRDGVMWIKASGTWLAHADMRTIMVPVRLAPMLDALAATDPSAETCIAFVDPELDTAGLRPSVETTMHAILPESVVLHVHCVDTIAWAVRSDAEDALAPMLAGLPWMLVPYARPGLPLTKQISKRMRPGTRVLVLAKHGLVVTGPTIEAAEALLIDVTERLRRPVRAAPEADPAQLAAFADGTPYRPASMPAAHALAIDEASLTVARLGSLYPDHVVFLGRSVRVIGRGEDVGSVLTPEIAPPKLLLAPGIGAFVLRDSVAAVDPMVGCLADVASRLHPNDPIAPLTADDEDALLGWNAEHYRQSLARAENER